MHEHRHERWLVRERLDVGVAEHHRLHAAEHRGECDAEGEQQEGRGPRVLAHGGGEDEEFAREHAEGRHAQDGQSADHEAPAHRGAHLHEAADVLHHLRAGLLRGMAHGEEDRALHERMHRHVQEPREVGDRPAHAEGEGDEPHVLDRGVGEHALHVALPRQEERRHHHGQEAEAHHHVAREARVERAVGEHLAADDAVERHVEEQPREHRGDRRGALGVRIRQPVVQRHQADLRAVAHQQEDEGERHDRGLQLALDGVEVGPEKGVAFRAQHALRREIEKDGAEERLGDAHAAQDEVLPRRLQARRRAVDRHQQHRREGGRLHRHPEDAHVVGGERQQHREHERLVHAVVQAQPRPGHLALLALDAHVGAREERGGEAHEGGEGHEEDVQGIDEELLVPGRDRAAGDDHRREPGGGEEGREAEGRVHLGCGFAIAEQPQERAAGERDGEEDEEGLH